MKRVKVTADLELDSEAEKITVKSDDNVINITISSSSAVIFPLRSYLKFKSYVKFSKNICQKINVVISGKKVATIVDGQIRYHQKWWAFQFLLASLFKKGI
ncbi:hypothetical protein SAMN05661096_02237 [Marivirga sericea]|uniref:Uncharacterized protein n=1 Tax=Marivirga sericea TaxID=1028 RepID=A0A1X7K1R5_9BACT|nr:hypothetical protein [Marivirga sericea]SMG34626.1 hypothetical protein SAMN05661096_02237 [Marivirga sericea]